LKVLDGERVSLYLDKSGKSTEYSFHRVFDGDTTQAQVFQTTSFDLVRDLIAGKNALLFTYGITNSGKTFTMQGTQTEGGILSRSMDILFNTIHSYRAKWYTFKSDEFSRMSVQVGLQIPIHFELVLDTLIMSELEV
jgi:hypothetical protein